MTTRILPCDTHRQMPQRRPTKDGKNTAGMFTCAECLEKLQGGPKR